MNTYRRPELPRLIFRDPNGSVIPYGSRWEPGSPADDSYSVVRHPERFRPLHAVARALIFHLAQKFDVDRTDGGPGSMTNRFFGSADIVETVLFQPRQATGAPVAFAFTAYPGVRVAAGLLSEFSFPTCGCDACDEDVGSLADQMEEKVFAVAAGCFVEAVAGRNASMRIWGNDWGNGANSYTRHHMSRTERTHIRRTLKALPEQRWQPWATRPAGDEKVAE
ncbi:MAG: DUF6226 family protein [Nakamurella sp.]